ncbi:MAG: hypothetical protein WAV45_01385 [Propionibacteriaceae bacterium]|nr:hypothetical protein [Micropruina sp.]HBX81348.1 hypothetical protein [Propionibacteriaceae bacterium]HBY24072.1 hypothetical protein [Propionibacteriaceae bacterium]
MTDWRSLGRYPDTIELPVSKAFVAKTLLLWMMTLMLVIAPLSWPESTGRGQALAVICLTIAALLVILAIKFLVVQLRAPLSGKLSIDGLTDFRGGDPGFVPWSAVQGVVEFYFTGDGRVGIILNDDRIYLGSLTDRKRRMVVRELPMANTPMWFGQDVPLDPSDFAQLIVTYHRSWAVRQPGPNIDSLQQHSINLKRGGYTRVGTIGRRGLRVVAVVLAPALGAIAYASWVAGHPVTMVEMSIAAACLTVAAILR